MVSPVNFLKLAFNDLMLVCAAVPGPASEPLHPEHSRDHSTRAERPSRSTSHHAQSDKAIGRGAHTHLSLPGPSDSPNHRNHSTS
jgi:hypothetical protein